MAKAVYVGVGSKARKMKKAYVGIGGKARKVKKMYIGDSSGKARLCYSAELKKVGTATALGMPCQVLAAASVGDYALFAGRYQSFMMMGSPLPIDAYDTSLTKSSPTDWSAERKNCGAASIGNHALFAGGGDERGNKVQSSVDAYDTSLTRSSAPALTGPRRVVGAAIAGDHALFAGGVNGSGDTTSYYKTVDAYSASLTRTSVDTMSSGNKYSLKGTTVNKYALFAEEVRDSRVEAYSPSLTRVTVSPLSRSSPAYIAATAVGNYAIFSGSCLTADVYDGSLTKTTASILNRGRSSMAAVTVGDYALFAGGYSSTDTQPNYEDTDDVDACDSSLTRTTAAALSVKVSYLVAATVGDYALFAGGYMNRTSNSGYSDTVDVYTA